MSGRVGARVEALHVYPVKGMRGRARDHSEVALHGLAGDRRWMVTDAEGGFLTQRQVAAMARLDAEPAVDGLVLRHGEDDCRVRTPAPGATRRCVGIWGDAVPAVDTGDAPAAWLSSVLGRPCRLVYMDDERARPVDPAFGRAGDHVGFADGFPLLAASLSSLSALNAELAAPVPMARFRPSVTISGLPPWSEDRWRRIRIGAMTFRAPKPCTRCVVVTRDQCTGEATQPGEPLRTLGRLNRHPAGIVFGANLLPDAPGRLAVGDPVEVLEALT